MRTRYLLGLIAVLMLILAVWLVPMALAAAGGSTTPEGSAAQSQPSTSQCPFLQTHPWLDPHGSGGGSGGATGTSSGTSSDVECYCDRAHRATPDRRRPADWIGCQGFVSPAPGVPDG
jgi:hypothetical protein